MLIRIPLSAVVALSIFLSSSPDTFAQQVAPSAEQQIKAAVLAAPQAFRDGAKVYGYSPEGEWTTLREGSNAMICIADDPGESNFHVACYFEGLEPFMKRGRELRAQGLMRTKVDSIRREEIEAGTLNLPQKPMTLYSLSGEESAYDYQSETLKRARPLTVVYVPFGTQESTGMTTSPAGPGAPWLMEPGTPWAHIMISGDPVGEETGQ